MSAECWVLRVWKEKQRSAICARKQIGFSPIECFRQIVSQNWKEKVVRIRICSRMPNMPAYAVDSLRMLRLMFFSLSLPLSRQVKICYVGDSIIRTAGSMPKSKGNSMLIDVIRYTMDSARLVSSAINQCNNKLVYRWGIKYDCNDGCLLNCDKKGSSVAGWQWNVWISSSLPQRIIFLISSFSSSEWVFLRAGCTYGMVRSLAMRTERKYWIRMSNA